MKIKTKANVIMAAVCAMAITAAGPAAASYWDAAEAYGSVTGNININIAGSNIGDANEILPDEDGMISLVLMLKEAESGIKSADCIIVENGNERAYHYYADCYGDEAAMDLLSGWNVTESADGYVVGLERQMSVCAYRDLSVSLEMTANNGEHYEKNANFSFYPQDESAEAVPEETAAAETEAAQEDTEDAVPEVFQDTAGESEETAPEDLSGEGIEAATDAITEGTTDAETEIMPEGSPEASTEVAAEDTEEAAETDTDESGEAVTEAKPERIDDADQDAITEGTTGAETEIMPEETPIAETEAMPEAAGEAETEEASTEEIMESSGEIFPEESAVESLPEETEETEPEILPEETEPETILEETAEITWENMQEETVAASADPAEEWDNWQEESRDNYYETNQNHGAYEEYSYYYPQASYTPSGNSYSTSQYVPEISFKADDDENTDDKEKIEDKETKAADEQDKEAAEEETTTEDKPEETKKESENKGSEYDISGLENINGKYLTQAENLVIYESNEDKLDEASIRVTVARNGESFELEKDRDYSVKLVGNSKNRKKYKYTINKDVFDTDGTYSVFLYSEDESGNVNYSETREADVKFSIDSTEPVIISCQDENEKENKMKVIVRDNMEISQVSVYAGDRLLNCNGDGETYEIELPEDVDVSELKVVACDNAGNSIERVMPVRTTTGKAGLREENSKGNMLVYIIVPAAAIAALGVLLLKKKKGRRTVKL